MIRLPLAVLFLLLCAVAVGAEVLPVTARARYVLKFELRGTGKIYPEEWYLRGDPMDYPGVKIRFLDAKKKPVPTLPFSNFHAVFSEKFTPGKIEFYAPDKAHFVEVSGQNAEFRSLKLEKVPAAKEVSIALDHRVSGTFRRTLFTPAENNMTIFDTSASYIYTSPVPVQPGEKYRLSVSGKRSDRSEVVIRVWFFRDSEDNRKSAVGRNANPLRVGGRNKNFEYTFITPPETRWIRVSFMWGMIWNYRIERVD